MTSPGGPLSKAATLHTLDGADKLLHTVQAGVDSLWARRSEWRRQLWRDYAPSLWLGYARFDLRNRQGSPTTVECTGSALRISPTRVVVTKELLQPWKFDVEIASAIREQHLHLNGYDLWLWPERAKLRGSDSALDPATAYRLSQGQLSVLEMPQDEVDKLVLPTRAGQAARVSVHRRNSAGNLAVLELAKPVAARTPHFAKNLQTDRWDSIAVFRFRASMQENEVEPELIFVSARRLGDRIRLEPALDTSAWGSALIAPEGIVGIVQDEDSAISWSEVVRTFKLEQAGPLTGNIRPR